MNVKTNYLKSVSDSQQVVIYGFYNCLYLPLYNALRNTETIEKVFTYDIGDHEIPAQTMEERVIEKIAPYNKKAKAKDDKDLMRECKIGIINLILENYKRKKDNLSIIPLIVCVDIVSKCGVVYKPPSSESVFSKEASLNELCTYKELRRCYKVYREYKDSKAPELRLLSDIAKETFKFVKVEPKRYFSKLKLTVVKPFWEDGNSEKEWAKRQQSSKKNIEDKEKNSWREELENKIINR